MGYKQADMFPSKYLSAEDFHEGEQRVVTVKDVAAEQFENKRTGKTDQKYIAELRNEKPLILNKTNANVMFELLGDDTDYWLGKSVTLWVKIVDSFGEEKPAIRVKTVLPENDPHLRQQPAQAAQPGYSQGFPAPRVMPPDASQQGQQTAMPVPPQAGEPMITPQQRGIIVQESTRIWGQANAIATAKQTMGNVNALTYQQAEGWITWLKQQANYQPPTPPQDFDDSDPFADE